MELSACLRAGSSLLDCDRFARGKDCPESRICFKVETVTRTERSSPGKDRNFFICRSHQRSDSPLRKEEHSLALVEIHLQWSYPLALELALHSSIVTDFARGKDCPESRICFKVETVTRTERSSPGKDRNFFICRSHQRSDSPLRREEHSLALVEIHLQWSYPLALELALHSSIVTDFARGKDCPESRICFKVETVTRTERSSPGKDRNFFICRSHQRSDSPLRREEHSLALVEIHLQWSYPLALELALHSSIVTDFARGKDLSRKSHLFQSRNSHTDGAFFPRERPKFLHLPVTPTE